MNKSLISIKGLKDSVQSVGANGLSHILLHIKYYLTKFDMYYIKRYRKCEKIWPNVGMNDCETQPARDPIVPHCREPSPNAYQRNASASSSADTSLSFHTRTLRTFYSSHSLSAFFVLLSVLPLPPACPPSALFLHPASVSFIRASCLLPEPTHVSHGRESSVCARQGWVIRNNREHRGPGGLIKAHEEGEWDLGSGSIGRLVKIA